MIQIKKPLLGIKPKYISEELGESIYFRFKELQSTIIRFSLFKRFIKEEWVKEYNEKIKEIDILKN